MLPLFLCATKEQYLIDKSCSSLQTAMSAEICFRYDMTQTDFHGKNNNKGAEWIVLQNAFLWKTREERA